MKKALFLYFSLAEKERNTESNTKGINLGEVEGKHGRAGTQKQLAVLPAALAAATPYRALWESANVSNHKQEQTQQTGTPLFPISAPILKTAGFFSSAFFKFFFPAQATETGDSILWGPLCIRFFLCFILWGGTLVAESSQITYQWKTDYLSIDESYTKKEQTGRPNTIRLSLRIFQLLEVSDVMSFHICLKKFLEHFLSYLLSMINIYNQAYILDHTLQFKATTAFISFSEKKRWMKKPL